MNACLAILVLAGITLLCAGVGAVLEKRFGRGMCECRLAVGLAALISAGGVLNALGLATRPVLIVLLLGGVVATAVMPAVREMRPFSRPFWLPLPIIVTVCCFAAVTQLRPSVFNYHDDLQKYFVHPVRMLATGTVNGGPLSAVGSETLGGQAFLQGIVTAFVPVNYINSVDAVFGLFLCSLIAATIRSSLPGVLLGVGALVMIDPQYVNVSGLYLIAALVMAAVRLGMASAPKTLLLGLVYAGMLALKTTAAIFVLAHTVCVLSLVCARGQPVMPFLARLAGSTVLFALPWLVVQAKSWLDTWQSLPQVGVYHVEMDILSGAPLFYGGTMLLYTALVYTFVIALILVTISGTRPWSVKELQLVLLAALLLELYYVFTFGFGKLYGNWAAVRYFTPFGIGLVPVIVGELFAVDSRRSVKLLAIGGVALALASFAPDCGMRIHRIIRQRTALAFSGAADTDYQQYADYVFSDRARILIELAQQHVPPGEAILAWLDFPFYLDFVRNPIFDIDTAGLGTPWARFPRARYVIWARTGYATLGVSYYERRRSGPGLRERVIATRTLDAMRALERAATQGTLLWEDGGIAVYRIAELPSAF
jgi:hypothetical protein